MVRQVRHHCAPASMVFRRASGITNVSVVMGRNALDAFGQQITGRRMADIAQTEDADHPLALVDHRQPADLELSMCRTALARSSSSRQQ